jgi:hypothetical protein
MFGPDSISTNQKQNTSWIGTRISRYFFWWSCNFLEKLVCLSHSCRCACVKRGYEYWCLTLDGVYGLETSAITAAMWKTQPHNLNCVLLNIAVHMQFFRIPSSSLLLRLRSRYWRNISFITPKTICTRSTVPSRLLYSATRFMCSILSLLQTFIAQSGYNTLWWR